MNMEELVLEIKNKIIEALNLKGMSPDEIDENAPLFKQDKIVFWRSVRGRGVSH